MSEDESMVVVSVGKVVTFWCSQRLKFACTCCPWTDTDIPEAWTGTDTIDAANMTKITIAMARNDQHCLSQLWIDRHRTTLNI